MFLVITYSYTGVARQVDHPNHGVGGQRGPREGPQTEGAAHQELPGHQNQGPATGRYVHPQTHASCGGEVPQDIGGVFFCSFLFFTFTIFLFVFFLFHLLHVEEKYLKILVGSYFFQKFFFLSFYW